MFSFNESYSKPWYACRRHIGPGRDVLYEYIEPSGVETGIFREN